MKNLRILPVTLLMITLFLGQTANSQEDWTKEKEKDGIVIYNRRAQESKLKEFKGSMKVRTTVEKAVAMFTDISKHEKFMYKCKPGSVKMIKSENAGSFYTYMEIVTPWPASARDVVTHYKVLKPDAKGSVTIELKGVPEMVPEMKGIVRVPMMKGYWKFTPLADGMVEVTHQALSSPGGSVPEGMANSASVDAPYYMLFELRKLLQQ